MENFKIGETVIALNSTKRYGNGYVDHHPREKGKTYVIKDVCYCSKCGQQNVNVGYKWRSADLMNCDCGNSQNDYGLGWSESFNFIRPSELKQKIAEAVEQENYEEAAELRDLILNK